jgi:hypothetical protein
MCGYEEEKAFASKSNVWKWQIVEQAVLNNNIPHSKGRSVLCNWFNFLLMFF